VGGAENFKVRPLFGAILAFEGSIERTSVGKPDVPYLEL